MASTLVASLVFDLAEKAPAAGDTEGKLQCEISCHPFGLESFSLLDWTKDGTLRSTPKRTDDILINDAPLKPDLAAPKLVTTSLCHPTNMTRALPSLSLLDWVTESPKPEPVPSRDIEAEIVTSSNANGIVVPGGPGGPEKESKENVLESSAIGIVVSGEPEKESEEKSVLEPAKENVAEVQRYTPVRAEVPLMMSRARPLSTTGGKVSDVEHGLRSSRHGRIRWHPHRLYGKFMFVATIKGARMPPEILLRKIAAMTPCNDMPILRQPAGAEAFPFQAAPNRRVQPQETSSDSESDSSAVCCTPTGPPICSRQHAISASIVDLGLSGVFAFDPFASLCCNSALARGWAGYDAHACKYCKARAR